MYGLGNPQQVLGYPKAREEKKKKDIKYTKSPKVPTQILKRLKLISHAAHSKNI